MPTTQEEASRIIEISKKYLSTKKLAKYASELNQEVGVSTSNSSLKESLQMLSTLSDHALAHECANSVTFIEKSQLSLYHSLWALTVATHTIFVITNLLAMFVLPFKAPWYITVPLVTFIFNLSFSRVECPSTKLENYFRRKLSMPEIGGFIGHYVKRPVMRLINGQ